MSALFILALVVAGVGLLQGQQWPDGQYGLIKAMSGCPEGGVVWHEGARKFDTEDSDAHNYFSDNVWNLLAGTYDVNDIMTEFCMKIDNTTTGTNWPNGSYCILEYNYTCPAGFKNGSIFWDDDDWNNHNTVSGTLPSGTYTSNTKIEFCCRNDAQPDIPVVLPTETPFVLFRYKYFCQKIVGMYLQEVSVRWDDEDLLNTDTSTGTTPYDDGGSKDHKLHFCHYSKPTGQPNFG